MLSAQGVLRLVAFTSRGEGAVSICWFDGGPSDGIRGEHTRDTRNWAPTECHVGPSRRQRESGGVRGFVRKVPASGGAEAGSEMALVQLVLSQVSLVQETVEYSAEDSDVSAARTSG